MAMVKGRMFIGQRRLEGNPTGNVQLVDQWVIPRGLIVEAIHLDGCAYINAALQTFGTISGWVGTVATTGGTGPAVDTINDQLAFIALNTFCDAGPAAVQPMGKSVVVPCGMRFEKGQALYLLAFSSQTSIAYRFAATFYYSFS